MFLDLKKYPLKKFYQMLTQANYKLITSINLILSSILNNRFILVLIKIICKHFIKLVMIQVQYNQLVKIYID